MSGLDPEAPAARFLVSGRVQGVGFRYFVRTLARGLGLAGRVRNLPDGRVEIETAGEEAALAAFERRLLAEGPGRPAAVIREPLSPAAARIAAWAGRFEIDL